MSKPQPQLRITKEQAVRIAYECGRHFRDTVGVCGGTGKPWDDLAPAEKEQAEFDFDLVEGPDAPLDQKLINLIAPFLRKFIAK